MKSKVLLFIISILTICALLAVFFLYKKELSICKEKIDYAFSHSLSTEMNYRLKENNAYISYNHDPHTKYDNPTVIGRDTTVVSSAERSFRELSIEKRQASFLQTVLLLEGNPINLFMVDSLFQTELKKENIYASTAILYKENENKILEHNLNKLPLAKMSGTTEHHLGFNDEIFIQGYAQILISNIISRSLNHFLLIAIIWFISTGIFISILFYRHKTSLQTSILNTRVKEITKTPSSDWYKINESILFNPEKSSIIYKDKNIPITNQSSQFLKLFLDAPEHFISTETIIQTLWGPLHEDTRLPQAINRFRAAIRPIPELTLKNIRGKGYQLIIHPE